MHFDLLATTDRRLRELQVVAQQLQTQRCEHDCVISIGYGKYVQFSTLGQVVKRNATAGMDVKIVPIENATRFDKLRECQDVAALSKGMKCKAVRLSSAIQREAESLDRFRDNVRKAIKAFFGVYQDYLPPSENEQQQIAYHGGYADFDRVPFDKCPVHKHLKYYWEMGWGTAQSHARVRSEMGL